MDNGMEWIGTCTLFEPSADCRYAMPSRLTCEKLRRRYISAQPWFAIQVALVEALGPRRHTGHGDRPQRGRGSRLRGLQARLASRAPCVYKREAAARGRTRLGGMAALAASLDEIASTLNEGECRGVGIAAFNSANSGHHCRALRTAGLVPADRASTPLALSTSPDRLSLPQCNSSKGEGSDLLSDLRGLRSRDSPVFHSSSTVSGALASGRTLGPAYWRA